MSDINKILDKDKILDWVYNGNATGFTIGEFTSLINMGYFNFTNSLITTIESQKEEIEKLTRKNLKAVDYAVRGLLDEADLNSEIESLKAITELAKNSIHDALSVASGQNQNLLLEPWDGLREAISKIERLSHE